MWQGGDFPLEQIGRIRWEEEEKKEKERKENREEEKMSEKLHFLSRFYRDWIVGFCRNKKQSSST